MLRRIVAALALIASPAAAEDAALEAALRDFRELHRAETHRARMMDALGCKQSVDLLRIALRLHGNDL